MQTALLLRVFTKIGIHRTVKDFATRGKESKDEVQIYTFATRGKESKDEVQIYTWRDTTLRELTDLMKEVAPAARKRDARLSFAFVHPGR
ncbi:hypothetical protein CY35_16G053700 [Sphagnum magellanicum]|nr:hypothetical protein CY35_16G053700 [Sphagnum magellanicum]KAH9537457.1 hypothetical protein CY35_16G053700 [Sphagnum magellanicum]